jgi:hypothetical protein
MKIYNFSKEELIEMTKQFKGPIDVYDSTSVDAKVIGKCVSVEFVKDHLEYTAIRNDDNSTFKFTGEYMREAEST